MVEESSIRTKKAVLGQVIATKISTNVKRLTLSFWISIVTLYVAITEETGVWRAGEDGIIFSWGAGDGVRKSSDWVFFFLGRDCSKQCEG